MDLSNVFNYKVHDSFPLEKREPVQAPVAASTFKWNNYSVEVLTKAALVCGSILAGSIFATASVVYSKIISGIVMIGFAAAAVVRWVNPPANRVQIPENTNLVEGQSVSLDHSEDIFITSTFEQPWYKDGKRVAGAVAGAAVLTGLSILAYYKVSDQEIDEGVSPAIFKGLISPAPWERPMLSNSAIDDALSHGGLSRAEAMKSFSKFFRVNNTLLEMANAQVFPMVSSKFSVCDSRETINLSSTAQENPLGLVTAENPFSAPKDAEGFLSRLSSFLSEESDAIPQQQDALNDSGTRVGQLLSNGPLLLSSVAVNNTLSSGDLLTAAVMERFVKGFSMAPSKFSASAGQENSLRLVGTENSSAASQGIVVTGQEKKSQELEQQFKLCGIREGKILRNCRTVKDLDSVVLKNGWELCELVPNRGKVVKNCKTLDSVAEDFLSSLDSVVSRESNDILEQENALNDSDIRVGQLLSTGPRWIAAGESQKF